MIPEDFIQKLLSQIDIVEYISSYVKLKLSGGNYFGLCPFHDEKSPSFSVSPTKNLFYCFGCQEGGNVIYFSMKINQTTFPETISSLAKEQQLELPQSNKNKSPHENIFQVLTHAKEFYRKLLHHPSHGKKYRLYLKERKIPENIQEKFQLGCTPEQSTLLTHSAQKSRFSIKNLIASGLSRERENYYSDYFKRRIIFPIFNESGKVVGFGGRSISSHSKGPKYLNSPENEVFKKGNILYGLNLAKKEIIKQNEVILVEGYMDVLRLHEHQICNAVATLGTSFSKKHAEILKRVCKNVIIINDNDLAGTKATLRSIPILLRAGLNVYVYFVSEGKDPDEFLCKNSREVFIKHMKSEIKDSFTFFYNHLLTKYKVDQFEQRKSIVDEACQFIQNYTHSVEIQDRLKQLSTIIQIPLQLISQRFKELISSNKRQNFHTPSTDIASKAKVASNPIQKETLPIEEKILISFALKDDSYIQRMSRYFKKSHCSISQDSLLYKIIAIYEESGSITFEKVASCIDPKGTFTASLESLTQEFDLENEQVFEDVFHKFYKSLINKRLSHLKKKLAFSVDTEKNILRQEMNEIVKLKHKRLEV